MPEHQVGQLFVVPGSLHVTDVLSAVHIQVPQVPHEPPTVCVNVPQPPQGLAVTQVPLQLICPPVHPHVPLLQVPPVGHVWPLPHAPQYVVDVFRFVSQPFDAALSQLPKPAVHDAIPQTPLLQLVLAFASEHPPQVLPPVPQLLVDWLLYASQTFPLQQPVHPDEVLQTHDPLLQVCPLTHPGEQDAPAVPQLVFDWLA